MGFGIGKLKPFSQTPKNIMLKKKKTKTKTPRKLEKQNELFYGVEANVLFLSLLCMSECTQQNYPQYTHLNEYD